MLPINVKALLDTREIESSRIEYKRKWNQAECIRTICAFANDIENQDGGYILIGVEEKNGRPVLPVSSIDPEEIDKIEKDLLNKCHFIEPFFLPRIEKYQIDDKYILNILNFIHGKIRMSQPCFFYLALPSFPACEEDRYLPDCLCLG